MGNPILKNYRIYYKTSNIPMLALNLIQNLKKKDSKLIKLKKMLKYYRINVMIIYKFLTI